MQDIREMEFRDSGSNANTKICFEVRATALRPRLHTEGFHYVYAGPPTKGTSTEEFVITNLEHKAKTQSPLHKRDEHKAKLQSPLHKRDKALSQNTISSTQEG